MLWGPRKAQKEKKVKEGKRQDRRNRIKVRSKRGFLFGLDSKEEKETKVDSELKGHTANVQG